MRTKEHYEKLLDGNPNADVGFTIAAQAVYAARHGVYPGLNADETNEEWRTIALRLKLKYGENMSAEAVSTEMESSVEI